MSDHVPPSAEVLAHARAIGDDGVCPVHGTDGCPSLDELKAQWEEATTSLQVILDEVDCSYPSQIALVLEGLPDELQVMVALVAINVLATAQRQFGFVLGDSTYS